jgi:hypothetical protein
MRRKANSSSGPPVWASLATSMSFCPDAAHNCRNASCSSARGRLPFLSPISSFHAFSSPAALTVSAMDLWPRRALSISGAIASAICPMMYFTSSVVSIRAQLTSTSRENGPCGGPLEEPDAGGIPPPSGGIDPPSDVDDDWPRARRSRSYSNLEIRLAGSKTLTSRSVTLPFGVAIG